VRCRELACPGRRGESSGYPGFSIKEQNLLHHAGLMVRDGSGAVSGAAAGLIVVVPANAGTYTPRPLDFGRKELLPPANIKPCGYGPLRSQGRRLRVVAAELVPLHLFGTASFVKQPAMRGHSFAIPPHVSRGLYAFVPPSRKQRAQGMPGDGLTHGPPATKKQAAVTTGSARSTGIPRAMVLTVSFALSSVTMLGCHRRPQDARASSRP
jgi:hypothetical protein